MFNRIIAATALGCIVGLAGSGGAFATTILVDDFNDGNDEGWTRGGSIASDNGGPLTYNAGSGEYSLGSSGAVTPGTPHYVASWWNESFENPEQFSNGYLRIKFRIEEEGTVAWVSIRAENESYIFAASSATNSFGIQQEGDVLRTVGEPDVPPLVVGEEWFMEAGTVGNSITLKIWPVAGIEPTRPQLALRNSAYSVGGFGLGANISHLFPQPNVVGATFDDIYFTPVPEPAAGLLTLLGIGGVACMVRRR